MIEPRHYVPPAPGGFPCLGNPSALAAEPILRQN